MGFRDLILKILKISPAYEKEIVIKEPYSHKANVVKHKILYRGDPSEIDQFFLQFRADQVSQARFWGSVASTPIRKIHSGIPQIVIDKFKDIILGDFDGVSFGEKEDKLLELWGEIAKDNNFESVLGEAITSALATGDGAFKVSIDTNLSQYPIIEFYDAENVDYVYDRGRLLEVVFYTEYSKGDKSYYLEEHYGRGYVRYTLKDDRGTEAGMGVLDETSDLVDITYSSDVILAVPLLFFRSPKFKNRGKPLFETKVDDIDALDEVISQWLDAVRSGRVKRYIPENFVPRNPDNGILMQPNPFDNQFVTVSPSMEEGASQKIEISQPTIVYDAFMASYAGFLDLTLQGIISPSTLGIDLKKTDNAESQREKEKVTLYTRSQLISVLDKRIPVLIQTIMMAMDILNKKAPKEYSVTLNFGEYSAPDFGTVVETVGKAKSYGVMSTEKAVNEMYGDTMTEEEKQLEIERIKQENSVSFEEPLIKNDDLQE